MAGQLLVVGSVNVDFVVRVARLPRAGETVLGGSFARHPGGKGGNQAVAAARLGAAVTFVGAVGDDDLGRDALAELGREGVNVDLVQRLPGVATGIASIIVDEGGENLIAVAPGANAALTGPLVDEALSRWRAAGEGGVMLASLEVSDEAVLAAALVARQRGMRVVVNPAPARALPASLLEVGPLLVPNQGEAHLLSGESDPPVAAALLAEQTGQSVVITLGAAGALVYEGGLESWIPARSVDVVDTTGAGDTFAAALATELAGGSGLAEAARFAVAAASLSVTAAGARGGMPRRDEVQRLVGRG